MWRPPHNSLFASSCWVLHSGCDCRVHVTTAPWHILMRTIPLSTCTCRLERGPDMRDGETIICAFIILSPFSPSPLPDVQSVGPFCYIVPSRLTLRFLSVPLKALCIVTDDPSGRYLQLTVIHESRSPWSMW